VTTKEEEEEEELSFPSFVFAAFLFALKKKKPRPKWQKVLTTQNPFANTNTNTHKTQNTHKRLEDNNSERVSLTSMLVRHPCMALVPNFTLAFPPSELSFSFTGCERYAPMSFTSSFTSTSSSTVSRK
jgi:hypothetical protein